ncbi:hypothetical protein [Olleya sp.]|jgi:hypothetical protein|uniref:hypothetical protein n=1 Tax=Olleya sp. TaxID=1906788 RepID=UPI0032D93FBA
MEKNKYDISELFPDSALKVFKLIDKIFKSDLKITDFNSSFNELNTKEQYYLCNYLEKYLDQSSFASRFPQWLLSKEEEFAAAGEQAMFYRYEKEVRQNRKKLLILLTSLKELSDKRYKFLEINNVKRGKDYQFLLNHKEDYKIPLPIGLENFKEIFISKLSSVITKQEAEQFYNNSIDSNKLSYPIDLLYLKPSNKSLLRSVMYELYIIYINKPKMNVYEMKRAVKSYNLKLEPSSESKRLLSQKAYKQPFKNDFVRVMYNAFPYIRVNFHRHFVKSLVELRSQKNHTKITQSFIELHLKNYLKVEARNLKFARKTTN